jgi:hypothetical protein
MNTLAKKDDKRYEYFIYKLYNPDCDFIYVGSTRDFTARKNKHKSDCNNVNGEKYNYKVYKTIREHDGFENWFMVVLEVMPDVTKLEAEMQEDTYRVQLNATMNTYRATRGLMTEQEYNKQHYIENREHYLEYQKQHYIENRETILARVKQYKIDNREAVLEGHKQYYKNNIERISAKQTQKTDCECGGKYAHRHKSTHIKSKKHQSYLSTL